MAEHTPGPWESRRQHPEDFFLQVWGVRDGNDFVIAADVEAEDALLIVAAPEMLEVAKFTTAFLSGFIAEVVDSIDMPERMLKSLEEVRDLGRSAIAKAEGRDK